MLLSLLEMMFGCPHKRFSFPQTRRIGGRRAGIYVVCLKCGSEFPYDWNRMVRASATSKAFTCLRCGVRRYLTVDHIKAESKGGQLVIENLQTLCTSCNCSKGNRG